MLPKWQLCTLKAFILLVKSILCHVSMYLRVLVSLFTVSNKTGVWQKLSVAENLLLMPEHLPDKEWWSPFILKGARSRGIPVLHVWSASFSSSADAHDSSFPSVRVRNGNFLSRLAAEVTLGRGQSSCVLQGFTGLSSMQCGACISFLLGWGDRISWSSLPTLVHWGFWL